MSLGLEESVRAVVRDEMRRVLREELPALLADLRPPGRDESAARDFLFVEEVARQCRVTPKTVRAWIEHGQLAAGKAGRRYVVARAGLEAFLASGQKEPQPQVEDQVSRIIDRMSRGTHG